MKYLLSLMALVITLITSNITAMAHDTTLKSNNVFTKNFHTLIPSYIAEVRNYYRVDAQTATGGRLTLPDAAIKLKESGFKTVIDTRKLKEGTRKEQKEVESVGLTYHNLPVSSYTALKDENVDTFSKLVDNAEKPVLIHCASGNRVGVLWAQYLINKGVDIEKAIEKGLRIGMRNDLANQVRSKYSKIKEK